ncbi:ABC transporter permease [Malaciobacter pacificus]|uniref:Sodium:sulfate symporter family protein n=1 Tax=Malaciobacter pacificus TaxID=1080223 RepID=A0A5C2H3E6_9BACT|nr:DASS family sodium-coupled anion symporter [Malaciobacter pacificus]QEP33431.1 sodium:sulfate symporter family protein [Malaciobacter pacificus]GGD31417.1 ABC transporter permease [Malaciobacter pacificus]
MSNTMKFAIPILVAIIVALIPTPEGLAVNAQYFFAIFLGVIVALILEPIPPALIGLTGVAFSAAFGLVGDNAKDAAKWALSGFSNGVIWLIFAAFMFALGYKKSGLGKRIALILVKKLGKTTLGLGYAVAFADGVLAPFMPSNTARSAGTIFPIAINIPQMFNSTPENEPRKIGSYISWVAIAATTVTSSMFLTALAPNLLAVSLVEKNIHIPIDWGTWFSTLAIIMIPLFLLVPILTYIVYPPEQKTSPEAPAWAAAELEKMGSITRKEILMLGLGLLALVLWIFGKQIGIDSTVAAIFVLCLLVLTNVITWEDVITNKGAINVFIWFATLVAMAAGLNKVGYLKWASGLISSFLVGMDPTMIALVLVVLFFLFHYLFASVTAHVVALLPLFLGIAANLLPADMLQPLAILLVGSLGLMGIITPYATGPSPIWYGAGYISQAKWWFLGLIFGAIFLAALVVLGLIIL